MPVRHTIPLGIVIFLVLISFLILFFNNLNNIFFFYKENGQTQGSYKIHTHKEYKNKSHEK